MRQETIIERLHHCYNCEHKRGSGFTAHCSECSCVIEGAARVPFKACPVGKWPAVSETPNLIKTVQRITRACCGSK